MTDREYLVLLYSFIPFGPMRIKLLTSYFGSAKKVWQASTSSLEEVGVNKILAGKFNKYRSEFVSENYFDKLEKLSISYVTYLDADYPVNLSDLDNSPSVLYVKGKLKKKDINSVAIVGARKMTSYGREVASSFSSQLAGLGITIVSGLARGIDSEAHKGALEAQGRTIAVMACGLDMVYPSDNTYLAKKIVDSGGALVSEYPLGYPPYKNNFSCRNRIISGLSRAVLIIEGEKKSGTLLTASHAADQGRSVFAVPGEITSPMSQAPLYLIQNGAKVCISPRDIIEELDMQVKMDDSISEKIFPDNRDEELIIDILNREPLHFDEIVRISSLPVENISARLTIMEMKGLIKNTGKGIYKKCY